LPSQILAHDKTLHQLQQGHKGRVYLKNLPSKRGMNHDKGAIIAARLADNINGFDKAGSKEPLNGCFAQSVFAFIPGL